MAKDYFTLLMCEFYTKFGLEQVEPQSIYPLVLDGEHQMLIAQEPAEWVTFLIDLGEAGNDAEFNANALALNLRLGDLAPHPCLGITEGRLVARAQFPLPFLTADIMEASTRSFFDAVMELRDLLYYIPAKETNGITDQAGNIDTPPSSPTMGIRV